MKKKWDSEEVKGGLFTYLEQGSRTEMPARYGYRYKWAHSLCFHLILDNCEARFARVNCLFFGDF